MEETIDCAEKKRERPKPTLQLREKDLPSIKTLQVGKEYTITMKARVMRVDTNENDTWRKKEEREAEATFVISDITAKPGSSDVDAKVDKAMKLNKSNDSSSEDSEDK